MIKYKIIFIVLYAIVGLPNVNAQLFGRGGGVSLAEVAKLTHSPGGMTITPRGSIILSLHQYQNTLDRVVEITTSGDVMSFPNRDISQGKKGAPFFLDAVLGLQCDKRGIVWMLDNGRRGESIPKIVGWDTEDNKLAKIIYIPSPATTDSSFLNDLAVDPEEPYIYITDPASGKDAALIIVNIETGLSRRVLEGHYTVIPEKLDITVDETSLVVKRPDGSFIKPQYGVGPIAIDRKGQWVYYGPSAGKTLYRIRTDYLRDLTLTENELNSRFQAYAPRPPCDGISIDSKDNIYISDVTKKAIGIIKSSTKKYEVYESDDRFLWPDGLCFGNDGKLYFYASQLHLTAPYNEGKNLTESPFHIYKLKALASGTVGK
jgi:sugar lactone lactonase YvrE